MVNCLLRRQFDSDNMVAALTLGKERYIEVTEVKHDREGNYHSLVRLVVTTEKQTRDVAGTLFADGGPRIVQVKGINIEAQVTPNMIYIVNEDLPGFIGDFGSIL